MAKKVILKDDNIEIMPITRGELVLDSSGQLAFHSLQFLATKSLPGLMSGEDKTKLDSLEKVTVEDKKVEQINTTTNNSYRILFSNSADDTTKTEGTRKSAKLLFNPSTGALTATALIGKLDWSNLNDVPEAFTPAQHIHNTSEITALTSYSKASSASDLITTDTLNVALGKLEYKANTAYTFYKSITGTDNDGIINKWEEIVDFVDSVKEGSDITDEFVTRKTGQTITGEKIFSGTSESLLTIDRNSTSPAWIKFAKNNTLLGYIGIDNSKKVAANIDGTVHYILHSGNSYIQNGVITINGATITPITSHQSLANYVTLNGKQNITGEKTFKATIKAYDINPVTNNTYSLGTSSLAWKNVYATNGNFSSTVNASGFVKKDSSDSYVLLGGGGHKALSDFAMASAYVKKAGDTMTGRLTMTGEGIIVTTATTSNYRTCVEFYKGTAADTTYSYDAQIGWHNTGGDGTGSICILPYATSTLPWGGSVGLFITKTDLKYNGASVWHSKNDGSGSGLDADLLDGKHASAFALASHGVHWEGFTKRANSNASWGTLIASNGYTPLFWLDSTNTGGVAFSDKSGQTFMQIDGYFYQNEGKNRVTDITETVTALGTSGNYLTWTKNGTTNNITIPYASSAGALGNYSIQHFMTYDNGNSSYLAASFTNENFSKKAAEKYIEYWDSTGGWFNSRWGLVLAISGFHRVGSSDSYVLLGGGGHKLESNLSVNYAASAGSASSCTGNAKGLSSSGYGNSNLTYYQTDGNFFGNSGWSHYIIANHGDGSSYYNFTIGLPFWGVPIYKRLEGGTADGWHTFITSENISSLSVSYASSAGAVAWGSITGKPSTFTPSTHYHNYFPENTAVYFRDPNNASWRGGMYWGSAGNEALCFAVVNANTSFRFFTGSDLANWTSSTWQGTPAFEVNKNGAYAPHFYENSDAKLKENIQAILDRDNIPQIKEFDWKESGKHSYGLIAQELEELGYSELVSTKDDGYKTVNYSAALSLIVGKLQVKIKELEKEIEILKNKN